MDTSTTTEDLVRSVADIPERMGASACFGAPVERDGHTLIPVARFSFGYGLGFGRGTGAKHEAAGFGEAGGDTGEGEGGGGGGGGSTSPVAVIDITRDDVVIKPVTDPTRLALAWMTLAGWTAFWLMLTIRTVARERAKTRRRELQRAAA